MQILGNEPRAAFPSAEPKALQSRNETAGARPRKVTRSSLRASLGAGAPSHLHRHFAGMGYGFAGRGKAPSPATAARRRSLEGKRAYPLPIGRLRRPRARCRARVFSRKGSSFPVSPMVNTKTRHRPPAPQTAFWLSKLKSRHDRRLR